jgi:hypothetical protein
MNIGKLRIRSFLCLCADLSFMHKRLPTGFVPMINLSIRNRWEDIPGKVLWEWLACLWVFQIPVLNGILNVGNMLLRP